MKSRKKHGKIARHKYATPRVFIPRIPWNRHDTAPDTTPVDMTGKTDIEKLEREIENNNRSSRRAKAKVAEFAFNNYITHFGTITYNLEKYPTNDSRYKRMETILKALKRIYGLFNYVLIPELHDEGESAGLIHWHVLIDLSNMKDEIRIAKSPKTGRLVKDKQGRQIHNIKYFDSTGFTNFTEIDSIEKAANYSRKYIDKNIGNVVDSGKKKYWSSRGGDKPIENYITASEAEYIKNNYSEFVHKTEYGEWYTLPKDYQYN